MYDSVLIATDGSDVAEQAATLGISLAEALEGTVHALSVVANGENDASTAPARSETAAESVVDRATEAGCDARAVVREGRPANEILATADEIDANLLVVGTHGRTGLRQTFFGSVALEVIRDARQPVISVGPDTYTAAETGSEVDEAGGIQGTAPFEEVLLATDGWPGSRDAGEHALELANALDATLHIIYAVDVRSDSMDIRDGFKQHGDRSTEALADRARAAGIDVTRTLVDGAPDDVILSYAADNAVDLVVMGTESKSRLERFVVGSVSQQVVSNAPVPVMTVRTLED